METALLHDARLEAALVHDIRVETALVHDARLGNGGYTGLLKQKAKLQAIFFFKPRACIALLCGPFVGIFHLQALLCLALV